jgi:hypothetical protein
MLLRVDPWDPEYGASVEFDEALEPAAGLDLTVDVGGAWSPIGASVPSGVPCCAFVDGVRRIDVRLFAEESNVSAPGLAGSWAAGCAWSSRPPSVGEIRVGRVVVTGGGLMPPRLEVRLGQGTIYFEPDSVPGTAPLDPLRALQNEMRDAEAGLAREVLAAGKAELVVADGPLSYAMSGPIVGLVKRQSRAYLDAERAKVIPRLQAGERTPLFKLGGQRLERFSWHLRLAEPRVIDGSMAGVVRLEVGAAMGLDAARELADKAAGILPLFASEPGHDARAPQNLYPVGALELHLRHRLGDSQLISRALEARLFAEATHG